MLGHAFGAVFDVPPVHLRGADASGLAVGVGKLVEVGAVLPRTGVRPAAKRLRQLTVGQAVKVFVGARDGSVRRFGCRYGDAIAVRMSFEGFAAARSSSQDNAPAATWRRQSTHVAAMHISASSRHHRGRTLRIGKQRSRALNQFHFDDMERDVRRANAGNDTFSFDDRTPHDVDRVHAVSIHADPLAWIHRILRQSVHAIQ